MTRLARGGARIPLGVPPMPSLVGLGFAAQCVWLDACPGVVLGASDALTIVVQP